MIPYFTAKWLRLQVFFVNFLFFSKFFCFQRKKKTKIEKIKGKRCFFFGIMV